MFTSSRERDQIDIEHTHLRSDSYIDFLVRLILYVTTAVRFGSSGIEDIHLVWIYCFIRGSAE